MAFFKTEPLQELATYLKSLKIFSLYVATHWAIPPLGKIYSGPTDKMLKELIIFN